MPQHHPNQPHPDRQLIAVNCAVVTISDTRKSDTDLSGELIKQLLKSAGHNVGYAQIIPDQPDQIRTQLDLAIDQTPLIQAIVFNGGTGISPRDCTYEAIAGCLTKVLPGFGEIFRSLSYAEIGTRAISSRAIAGVYHQLLVFSLPGSTGAVRLGTEKLILPELVHLVTQLARPE